MDETLAFELLLQTNIANAGGQAVVVLKEIKTGAQDAATSVETMGTASEQAAAKVSAATQKELNLINQYNQALAQQAEQEARIDGILANMQARRAQSVPVAQSGAVVPATGAGEEVAARFNAPSLAPMIQEEEQATIGYRGMRMEMIAFSSMAMLSLGQVEGALGKDAQAAMGVRVATEAARVGMSMLVLESMGLSGSMLALTGGLLALAAAIPIGIELWNKDAQAKADDIKMTDALLVANKQLAESYPQIAAKINEVADAEARLQQQQGLFEQLSKNKSVEGFGFAAVLQIAIDQTKQKIAELDNELKALASSTSSTAIEDLRNKEDQLRTSTDSATAAAHAQITAMQYQAAAAEQLAKSIGDTRKEAIADTHVDIYATAQAQAQGIQKRFEDGTISLGNAVAALGGIVGLTGAQIQTYRQQLLDAAIATNDLQTNTQGLNEDYHATTMRISDAAMATNAAAVQTDAFNTSQDRLKTKLADDSIAFDKAVAAAKAYESVLASLASAALTPTKVEGTDATRMQMETELGKIEQKLSQGGQGPQQTRILQQQAADIQAAMGQLGPYVDKWDEYARRLEAIKSSASQGVINPDWAKMIPADVLAKGAAAVQAWAAAEEQAFYAGQRLDKIDYSALKGNIDTQITDIIGKFEMMQAAEQAAATELANLQKTDPSKYQEFLKAENLAPNTSAQDAAKTAFGNVAKAVDPAQKAVGDYSSLVKGIPAAVTTKATWDDKQARADILDFEKFLDDFVSHYGGIDINVNANLHAPAVPTGSTGSGIPKYAGGGAGVFAQDQLIYVHANEGFWFSGTDWQVPPPNTLGRASSSGASSSGSSGAGGVTLNIQNLIVGSGGGASENAREFLDAVKRELSQQWGGDATLRGSLRI